MRISDWSSDVCSSDLANTKIVRHRNAGGPGNIPGIIVAISCLNLAFEIVRDILADDADCAACCIAAIEDALRRSEEHTSELQSLMRISYAVFCLKKKKTKTTTYLSIIFNQLHNTTHNLYII